MRLARLAWVLAVVASLALVSMPSAAAAADDPQVGGPAIVTGTDGSGLRVRSGPGMSYRVVTTVAEGSIVQVVAGPISDDNDDWYQIKASGGVTGWCLGRYLTPTGGLRSNGPASSGGADDARRSFVAKITAYADGVGGLPLNARTATGTKTRWGVVAVDPTFVPLGSSLAIEGYAETIFFAEDIGGAIKGPTIDIWLPDPSEARRYGTQFRKVIVLREGSSR